MHLVEKQNEEKLSDYHASHHITFMIVLMKILGLSEKEKVERGK